MMMTNSSDTTRVIERRQMPFLIVGVIGLLAWLYLEAELTLYAVEINVVLAFRLWPRSVAPPPYTEQDRQAFQLYAQMEERSKNEDVAVEDPDSEGKDDREKTSG